MTITENNNTQSYFGDVRDVVTLTDGLRQYVVEYFDTNKKQHQHKECQVVGKSTEVAESLQKRTVTRPSLVQVYQSD